MKKLPLSLLLTAAFFSSCKKESQPIRDRLIGTWNETKVAHDDNQNGHMDLDEIHNISNPNKKTYILNQDGSAVMRFIDSQGGIHPYDCTWTVTSDDSLFVTMTDGSGGDRSHIAEVTSSQLVLQFGGESWSIYTK